MKLDLLTIDMFSDKVGQAFTVEEAGVPPIALTLIEVTLLQNYAKAERAPFSLIFTSQGTGRRRSGCTVCGMPRSACNRSSWFPSA